MPSRKEYLYFILDQLAPLGEVSYRAMMGEYILYYGGRVVGGIYDDRLLVKDIPAAREYMGVYSLELPYDGAKPMLFVDEVDDRDYLCGLLGAMYPFLPDRRK